MHKGKAIELAVMYTETGPISVPDVTCQPTAGSS